ncbi:MAG: SRPBCC family protein [Pyrinomonadaceae bacterium]|nr:SRPBCC family protein [Sphingobacteriaceae bacterium]
MIVNILFIVAIIIAIPLVIALFVKKEYKIERKIIIDKPNNEVFEFIRFLKNQEQYSKWVMMDPNMKKEFRGIDGTVGFVYAWDGNDKAGKGEQELISMVEGKSLDIELRFERPFKAIAKAPMLTDSVSEDKTRVTWGMQGKYNYPMNLMNLVVDKILGKDMETSLVTLKGILEK